MPRPTSAIKMETFCVRAPSGLVKRLMRLFSEQSTDITWKDFVISILESGLASRIDSGAKVNFSATAGGPVEQ